MAPIVGDPNHPTEQPEEIRRRRTWLKSFMVKEWGGHNSLESVRRRMGAIGYKPMPTVSQISDDFKFLGIIKRQGLIDNKIKHFYGADDLSFEGKEIDLPLSIIRQELKRQIALKVIRMEKEGKEVVLFCEPFEAKALYLWIKNSNYPYYWYAIPTDDLVVLHFRNINHATGFYSQVLEPSRRGATPLKGKEELKDWGH